MEHLLEGLTPAQREAVQHRDGPLLVLAGPGSGKTRVITHRIACLLHQGVPPSQILALTFTNKAADEMRQRVETLAPGRAVWLSTFHRFCARLLRKYAPFVGIQENYTIYDEQDRLRAIRHTLERLKLGNQHATPEQVRESISWAKNRLIPPDQYQPKPGSLLGQTVSRVYPAYQAFLASSNAADFDDLLMHVVTLLRENPEVRQALDQRYRYILVDEYQDTNLAQYAIARALSIDWPNLMVTGDPDQSIYGWRGANLSNILDFERDFSDVRVVRLEQNYRSTGRILRVAGELIRHNIRRKQKDLFTENGDGPPVRLLTYATQKDEAEHIAQQIAAEIRAGRRRPRDFAIFYRINALSRAFEMALHDQGVPYQLINGQAFFQRKEIRDVLAYLQLLNNPRDDIALMRVINTPIRGIGKTTVGRLADAAVRHGRSMLEQARAADQVEKLSSRSVKLVGKFVAIIDRLAAVADRPLEEIVGHVLSESGYRKLLDTENQEDQERLANLEELLTVAREFDERHGEEGRLEAFLEEISLVNDTDDWETAVDRVTLMTLHASKGLEFPVVYLVAVEEGLLPHERSRQDEAQLEEERRLMFVGVTRTQEQLQLSMAQYRDFRGQRKITVPSHFLMELPRDEMVLEWVGAEEPMLAEPSWVEPVLSRPRPEPAMETASQRPSLASLGPMLTTAAELAGEEPSVAVDPDAFHHGMVVRHPKYGLGRIVAISGQGERRKATVDFVSPSVRKQFVLAESRLRPVRKT